MNVQSVIESLRAATKSDRKLDVAIATLVGYERRVVPADDPRDERVTVGYVQPPSNELVKIPGFTRSIDDAYALAQVICPSHVAGFSWHGTIFRSRIDDGPVFEGATPAIAICIAALTRLKDKRV